MDQGKATVIAAVIGAIAVVLVPVVGWYTTTLQSSESSALQEDNTNMQAQTAESSSSSDETVSKSQEHIPESPVDASITELDGGNVSISWTPIQNADYYEIERYMTKTDEWVLDRNCYNRTDFITTKSNNGASMFRIRAVNSTGASEWKYASYVQDNSSEPIIITEPPKDWVGDIGQDFSINVTAIGEGLTYQWYFRNAGALDYRTSEEIDNTYGPFELTALRNGREVYCVISDRFGNQFTTDTVTINSNRPAGHHGPVITEQPKDWVGAEGEYPSISVSAEGEDLTYQWYIKDIDSGYFSESSETDDCYDSFPMTKERDGRELYCVIIDKYDCSITSHTVTMRIG